MEAKQHVQNVKVLIDCLFLLSYLSETIHIHLHHYGVNVPDFVIKSNLRFLLVTTTTYSRCYITKGSPTQYITNCLVKLDLDIKTAHFLRHKFVLQVVSLQMSSCRLQNIYQFASEAKVSFGRLVCTDRGPLKHFPFSLFLISFVN